MSETVITREGWLTNLKLPDGSSTRPVIEDSGIRVGKVINSQPRMVWHTTESSGSPAYVPGVRPTFTVGPRVAGQRPVIIQHIPLGWMATALRNLSGGTETNRLCVIQVEQVGFTTRDLWEPEDEQAALMGAIAQLAKHTYGVPKEYPYNPKDIATGLWATESNPWRRSGKFVAKAGHHPHLAVPENTHWDCGGEDIPSILEIAYARPKIKAYQLVAVWPHKGPDGVHWDSEEVSPHFADQADLKAWTVRPDDTIRKLIWQHLKAGHRLKMATRKVDATKVQ